MPPPLRSSAVHRSILNRLGVCLLCVRPAAQVFRCIARTPNKEFLLRLSMMEIYNEVGPTLSAASCRGCILGCGLLATHNKQGGAGISGRQLWAGVAGWRPTVPPLFLHPPTPQVLNDLLDPARTNLRLREDQRKVRGERGGIAGFKL